MADRYALEQVGAADGTQSPPKKLDGRLVGAKDRIIRASLPGVAMANGDRLYLGKKPAGSSLHSISGLVSATLGTTTLSIGTTANPTKYVNAKTLTAVDTPTALGPVAAQAVAAPSDVDEDLWLTLGVGGIANTVVGAIRIHYSTST